MTSPSERREALRAAVAMIGSALVVVTCSAQRQEGPSPIDAIGRVLASDSPPLPLAPSAPAAPPSAAPALASSAPTPAPPAPRPPGAPLARFHAALDDLTAGRRTDHVRIVWLGDSHTAADLWTGAARDVLQGKYGDGGPGFVHLGWNPKQYRHGKVRSEVSGRWKVEPGDYARQKRYDDGVQGLGGVRMVLREPGGQAWVEPRQASPPGGAYRWDLAYRALDGATLRWGVGEGELHAARPGDEASVQHQTATTLGPPHRLTVEPGPGKVQLLGVVIEATKPGLVLDAVGLNGARVGTFLGWDAAAWQSELGRRHPDLVVLAFGTNESSDLEPSADRHAEQTRRLLDRVQAAAPGADCAVITPVDRAGEQYAERLAVISAGMAQAARERRCWVWSALEAMGGPGSMASWAAERPPRGGADGVHLAARGYTFLGEMLARDLMAARSAGGGLPPAGKEP